MSSKNFIGGGFPGIRECVREQTNITKESREKREFSIRKIIPINQILTKRKPQTTNNLKLSEEFNVKNNTKYEHISSNLSDINNNFSINDLHLINSNVARLNNTSNNTKSNDSIKVKKSKRGSKTNSKSKPKSKPKTKPKRGSKTNSKSKSKSKSKRGSKTNSTN